MKSPMTRVQEKELGKIYQLLYYLKNTNTTHSQIHHMFFVCGEEMGSPICNWLHGVSVFVQKRPSL